MGRHSWQMLATVAAVTLFVPQVSLAAPITSNVRPVAGGYSSEPSLGSILGCMFYGDSSCDPATTSLTYDAYNNQDPTGIWGSPGTLGVTLQQEYTGNTSEIGLWSGTDTNGPINTLKLFDGSATGANNGGATTATVQFTGGAISIFGPCGLVNCQTSLFGTGIDPLAFGFYLTDPGGHTFYSMDILNPGGETHALAFPDGLGNWAIGFEDQRLIYSSDHDYNDEVLKLQAGAPVVPAAVPEPGTFVLFGTGLLGLGRRLRRRVKATR